MNRKLAVDNTRLAEPDYAGFTVFMNLSYSRAEEGH